MVIPFFTMPYTDHTHSGYTQTLRPGVKASFGLALDTQKLNDVSPVGPSHKVRPDQSTMDLVLTPLPGWRQLGF
jgi:hypothetical protein